MTGSYLEWPGLDTLVALVTGLARLSPEELRVVLLGDALIVLLLWIALGRWARRAPQLAKWLTWLRWDLGLAYVVTCGLLWWLRR